MAARVELCALFHDALAPKSWVEERKKFPVIGFPYLWKGVWRWFEMQEYREHFSEKYMVTDKNGILARKRPIMSVTEGQERI